MAKKGTVEVVSIQGDHMAQCRIIKDSDTDPILVHDKVMSGMWTPGQQLHFALSGVMNLDGDGRHQAGAVISLIRSSGGVVDCWLDEHGQEMGRITSGTQYLVTGDPPDKSSKEMIDNNAKILGDAERNQLHRMTLTDLKQKTNYQKSSSVEHFGAGAGSVDANAAARAARAAAKAKPASKAPDDAAK